MYELSGAIALYKASTIHDTESLNNQATASSDLDAVLRGR